MSVRLRTAVAIIGAVLSLPIPVEAQTREHRVQRGETVYRIARRYGVEPSAIVLVNDLDSPDLLTPGTMLQIPGAATVVHTVEHGDTLYSIARRYGVDVAIMQRSNRLADTTIRPGQRLTVPASATPRVALAATPGPDPTTQREIPTTAPASPTDTVVPPRNRPSDRSAVAPVVSRPLSYSQGGVWPVTGARADLEGKLPGVMIHGARGDDVLAVATGRVVYAGPHTTFGNVVLVRNGAGYVYVYGGQEGLNVGVGDDVQAGSTLGTVGNSPTHGDGTLYFSVWKNDQFIDPGSAPRG